MIPRVAIVVLIAAMLSACVSFPDAPPASGAPRLEQDAVVSVDGARLGLTSWVASEPKAAIVAVHGMNDYAAAFTYAGPYWSARGISVYAYDQRGFGRSPAFGRWAGGDTLRQDLRAVIAAVHASAPTIPVYVVGHSMGCAVILTAMRDAPLDVDGVILGAPGVWGGASMPIFYRATLNLAASFAPGKTLTGERAGRQASDNIEFLRAMYEDPLIIKETRLDAILGVERIMGEAYDASDDVAGDMLMLIGEKDEIIPSKILRRVAERLPETAEVISLPESWHMVFADLEREKPLSAVIAWIERDLAANDK
ncbi:MAG: lysophospholipase [Parvularculaceae bacterium]|nr:lysophospholipase [Parvularculaceae bacterium]